MHCPQPPGPFFERSLSPRSCWQLPWPLPVQASDLNELLREAAAILSKKTNVRQLAIWSVWQWPVGPMRIVCLRGIGTKWTAGMGPQHLQFKLLPPFDYSIRQYQKPMKRQWQQARMHASRTKTADTHAQTKKTYHKDKAGQNKVGKAEQGRARHDRASAGKARKEEQKRTTMCKRHAAPLSTIS